jgi:hypothetical protein
MERQQERGPAFQTETVSHECLLIFTFCVVSSDVPLREALPFGRSSFGRPSSLFSFRRPRRGAEKLP